VAIVVVVVGSTPKVNAGGKFDDDDVRVRADNHTDCKGFRDGESSEAECG
jgi:hypothetical protein